MSMKKIEFFKVEGDKINRVRKHCPKCGPGVFLAEHSNRFSCGKCGYTEFKGGGRKEQPPKIEEKPVEPKDETTTPEPQPEMSSVEPEVEEPSKGESGGEKESSGEPEAKKEESEGSDEKSDSEEKKDN